METLGIRRPAVTVVAVLACLLGVALTAVVPPATGGSGDGTALSATAGSPQAPGGVVTTVVPGAASATPGPIPVDGSETTPGAVTPGGGAPPGPVVAPTGPGGATRTAPPTPGGTPPGDGTGAAPTPDVAPAPAGEVRGVSADRVRIGVALLDVGALESVARIGDVRAQVEAAFDGMRQKGLLPVHGRDVELVFRSFDAINPETQRALCVAFAQDDKVFMVMGTVSFVFGAECLAREYQIPVLASAGTVPGAEWFARTHPWAFYTNMSDTRAGQNWAHWLVDNELVQGKKIGLNYLDDPAVQEQVRKGLKEPLAALGYDVALDFPSPDNATNLTVQRFAAEGIDLALVMGGTSTGSGVRAAEFTRAAQTQGYTPAYAMSEFVYTGGNAAGFSESFDPDQFDGTLSMSYYQRATDGQHGNPPIPAAGVACEEQYEAYTGEAIDRSENANEWDVINLACDHAQVIVTGLTLAGVALTPMGMVGALEAGVKDQPSGGLSDITFGPGKHDGAFKIKSMRWSRDCLCWLHHSDFRGLYVT